MTTSSPFLAVEAATPKTCNCSAGRATGQKAPTSPFGVSTRRILPKHNPQVEHVKEEHTMQVWGLHNDTLTTELTEENFVSLGWNIIGDLTQIPGGRDELKAELARITPEERHK